MGRSDQIAEFIREQILLDHHREELSILIVLHWKGPSQSGRGWGTPDDYLRLSSLVEICN